MSVDLGSTFMGLRLAHPIVPGASPLVDDLDMVRRLEDAGAPCLVMHSLFEEQIQQEDMGLTHYMESHDDLYAEATSYFPRPGEFALGPDRYLAQIRRIRETVAIPVVASLNGVTPDRWLQYARLMEQAGAGALELNLYFMATDPSVGAEAIESRMLEVVRTVRDATSIPLAVKLSPYFTSIASLARRLDAAGADGLVLFNRFYQPDIDIERLEAEPSLRLSDPSELLLRLRWTAVLRGRIRASLAVTGGVHSAADVIKATMAGADMVQVVSSLLRHGPSRLATLRDEVVRWMEEHEYASLEEMRGSMSLIHCPDPSAYERANYMRILMSWPGPS